MRVLVCILMSIIFCAGPLYAGKTAKQVVKISKEELLSQLERHDFFLLDVRPEDQWANSPYKIRHAQHEDPLAFATWSKYYPKEKKIVLYCA